MRQRRAVNQQESCGWVKFLRAGLEGYSRYSRGSTPLVNQLSPQLEPLAIRCINLLTTAGGTVRFNPNLYKDGKVSTVSTVPRSQVPSYCGLLSAKRAY